MRAQLIAVAVTAVVLAGGIAAAEVEIDSNTFGGLRARPIGPAVMSGRVAALAAVAGEPLTLWVGAASGGVWKSTDGGLDFKPVFDKHIQSIGALAIDPKNPDVVWVGTGETWSRNSVSIGDGVYRTTDGGDSWEHLGLAESERIARIMIHPEETDTVYVCATGHLWNANEERGVYRTTDGGKTWDAVLQVDADTGCSDLALDPEEPGVLYAGMWQFRRQPWIFDSGGSGSGLYKSTDGGDTWRELTEGLPAGEKGRVAVTVAPSRPRTVYSVIEAKPTALYRSDDLGEHWTEVSQAFDVQARPFYFGTLIVDPIDHERLYKPGFGMSVSEDGGKTFTQIAGAAHGDFHDVWVDPRNPMQVVVGTDGGVYISSDRNRFRHVRSLPISQFYEVSVDLERPYNVYGGLQDNGSWLGPSRSTGGIRNGEWRNIGFGDGFHVHVDPQDPDYSYLEYQGGNIMRVNMVTGEVRDIKPLPQEDEPKFRFNWNTPIHLSPSRPGTVYVGAQFLFRSADRGESWERISDDLTTNDPSKQRQEESGGLTIDNSTAENHTTLHTISESPFDPNVIWVGTDDGNVQVTRDGGKTWTDATPAIDGVPPATWVSHVEAGRHAAGTAFVTFDGHRTGDMAAYAYRTDDFGASWTSLAGEGIEGFAHVILQDPVDADLLFAGTELGLYLSLDGGGRWARFSGNLPKVPVHDLVVHPRDHDLVIGTHGRGIYILDDLTPLRALTPEVLEANAALLPSRTGEMGIPAFIQDFPGDGEFVGENPQAGAGIAYYLKKRHLFGDLKLEVYGPDGELISTLPTAKRKGINRVGWPMRLPAPKMPPATSLVIQPFSFFGPTVAEGTYTVRLVKGKETYESQIEIGPDGRSVHSAEDRAAQRRTARALYDELGLFTYLIDALVDLRDQARAKAGEMGGGSRSARRLEGFADDLEDLRGGLVSTSEAGFIGGDEKLREQLGFLYGGVNGYAGAPTRSQLDRLQVLQGEVADAQERFAALHSGNLETLNGLLVRQSLEPIAVMSREAWEESQESAGSGSTLPLPRKPVVPKGFLAHSLAAFATMR